MHLSTLNYQSSAGAIQIAFVAFERQLGYDRVASILYDEYKIRIQGVDAIILRPPVDIQIHKIPLEEILMIIKRFPHIPLYLLYSVDYIIELSANVNTNISTDIFTTESKSNIIQFLQQKELEDFVLHSSAILRSPENTVFRTPSQEYSHTFLRVGNIQTSRHVLDSVFFWTIPYLKDAGSILTDSWSISSIALNISRLLCRYDSKVKMEEFHVNMLTSHYNGEKKMDRDTENNLIALTYGNTKKILFLISAVKTQKSLNNIRKAFLAVDLSRELKCLAIYKLINTTDIDFLCELGEIFCVDNSIRFDSYTDPPAGEKVLEIDDRIFFPLKAEESEIEIRKGCTTSAEEFFRNYEGCETIYIHRDSYYLNKDKFRHHGIYLDISKMLLTDRFTNRIKEQIDAFEKAPSLIIYPPHEHGKDLVDKIVEFLKERFSLQVPDYSVLDLDFAIMEDGNELVEALKAKKEDDFILVVDDVSTTGSRLRNYQKRLRDIFAGQICYFIGVARPDHNNKWDKNIKNLTFRSKGTIGQKLAFHKVVFIEKLVIPDWDEKTCPWCKEKLWIEKVATKKENQAYPLTRNLKTRYHKLNSSTERGLLNDVFFSISATPKPSFQGGSIFASSMKVSEADLVAIVAAGIQFLRNEGGNISGTENVARLEADYPHFKIIKVQDYLGAEASFNEALIKAIIFRTTYKKELHATADENLQKQKEGVLRFFNGQDMKKEEIGFFIYELYLALKERKLPKPDIDKKLIKILEQAFKDEIAIKL